MRLGNRIAEILRLVRGKEVLDIGCTWIDDDGTWVHGEIARVAKTVMGIDIADVLKFRSRGFDIVEQSAEEPFNLNRVFDVVVAAEVLDHTSNLGIFLDNVKRHLKKDGQLVVTIHNPQAFEFFLEQLVFKGVLSNIYEHTHWQSEVTMSYLLKKHGLRLKYKKYIHYKAFSKKGKIYDILTLPLPSRFSRCVLYVAGHDEK